MDFPNHGKVGHICLIYDLFVGCSAQFTNSLIMNSIVGCLISVTKVEKSCGAVGKQVGIHLGGGIRRLKARTVKTNVHISY